MRDIKSLLLALLSVGLICTWIYHLYDKTMYSQRRTEIYIKDSIAVAEGVRDSLQKIYAVAINDLDSKLDSSVRGIDSLQSELGTKMDQIKNLKKEIGDILGKRGVTREELGLARNKINELQQMVDDLRTQNGTMEDERKRLAALMEQLNGEMRGLEQNIRKLGEENKVLTEKINMASVFVASEIKLSAVTLKGSREEETSSAKKTKKFVFSFVVQNNVSEYNGAEVYVVITAPDGQVMHNLDWEARTIETKSDGTKEYTLKIRLDYQKGEQKHQLFTIDADRYQKGSYTLQIYHNGYRIGQITKTLT